ncbi:MAG: hypothetical protein ACRD21_22210, partial [Vicinamibacteria bacterium]
SAQERHRGGAAARGMDAFAAYQAEAERLLKSDLADEVLDSWEARSGRPFDAAYRVSRKKSLMNLSVAELEGLRDSDGYADTTDLVPPLAFGSPLVDLVFTPVVPCRLLDTRLAGGIMGANTTRDFRVTGSGLDVQGGNAAGCGIPFGPAKAAIVNFTAVTPTGAGNLRAYAWDSPAPAAPLAATQNYGLVSGQIAFNNGTAVPLCNTGSPPCTFDIIISNHVSSTHVVADIVGYFSPLPTPNTTVLHYVGASTETNPMFPDFVILRTIGAFNKLNASTSITTNWSSHVQQTGTPGTTFCHFQLRIDGAIPSGAGANSGVVLNAEDQSIEQTDFWTGLAAGAHTVAVFVRGDATTCTENFGSFSKSVMIVEQ